MHPNSDISLKELILRIKSYINAILKKWLLVVIMGFGLAFLFFIAKFNIQPLYTAELSYMLNEDESGGIAGISAVLGQFGFGALGGSESNLDKIIELSKTRRIAQRTLLEKQFYNDKEDYIANHLIEAMEASEEWNKKGMLSFLSGPSDIELDNFRFTRDSFELFSITENTALKILHKVLMGEELNGGKFQSSYSEITGIMKFSMTSSDAELSILIVKSIYNNLKDYYTEKSTEKQKADYNIIKTKYDSITTELNGIQYRIAKNKDTGLGLTRSRDLLPSKKLVEDERRLQLMLGEAEKQKQLAELTLGTSTPYIQIIDSPILPLKPVNKSRIFYFLFGGLLGGILAISYIIIRKVYSDIMSS